MAERSPSTVGVLCGAGAFVWWGIAPLYFKALKQVPSLEILAHRVVWSVALLLLLVAAMGRVREIRGAVRGRLHIYVATTTLVSLNWLLFIWAVNNDHVLEASLGYFINPLVNVILGVVILRESLNGRQKIAVVLAAIGVLILVTSAGVFPWISLALAATFAFYGLLRKRAPIDPFIGLLVETALLAPIAIAFLAFLQSRDEGFFTSSTPMSLMLMAAGPVTSVPLILFAAGVRRLPLSMIGLLQYLAPTGQFLLAVLAFGEPFTAAHIATFSCIWTSLAIYSGDAILAARRSA